MRLTDSLGIEIIMNALATSSQTFGRKFSLKNVFFIISSPEKSGNTFPAYKYMDTKCYNFRESCLAKKRCAF